MSRRMPGAGFSREYPEGGERLTVLVAKATIALNAIAALDKQEAEAVARAFLSGSLTPKKERTVLPWQTNKRP
jgi:hypothetical protein